MKDFIDELKDIMIEAAEYDHNYELAKRLKDLRKKEKSYETQNTIFTNNTE